MDEGRIDLLKSLTDIMFDKSASTHSEIKINPLLLKRYAGKYNGPQSFEIIQKENKLFQRVKDQPDTELKPESNTTFYYPDGNKQIDFWVTPWGEVEKAFWVVNGKRIEIKKNKNYF